MRQEDHAWEVERLKLDAGRRELFLRQALQRIEVDLADGRRDADALWLATFAGRARVWWVPLAVPATAEEAAQLGRTDLIGLLHGEAVRAGGYYAAGDGQRGRLHILALHYPAGHPMAWKWLDELDREHLLTCMRLHHVRKIVRGVEVRRAERGIYVAAVFIKE